MARTPQLLDYRGRPIRRADLTGERSGPTTTGLRSVWSTHDLGDLTPERVAAILREAETPGHGASERYVELAEVMEERDLHYLGTLQVRRRRVAQIGVTVEPVSDAADDVRDADLVRAFLGRADLEDELIDLLDALGKGYSVCEILWDHSEGQWVPQRLEWRLPQWFDFDRDTGARLMQREGGAWAELAPWKYVTHTARAKAGLPIRGGLARVAAWAWLIKRYALHDWARFLEVYGHPFRLGRYDAGSTDADRQVLYRAVRELGVDMAAIIPDSMSVELVSAQGSTANAEIYRDLITYLDNQVSIAVLGQTLTTQPGASGSYALGQVHQLVREDIERSDGRQLAATLRRDLAIPMIQLNHGPRPAYPRTAIERISDPDMKLIAESLEKLVPLGLRVRADQVRTWLGLDAPDDDDEVLAAPRAAAPPGAPPPDAPDPPEPPPARARDAGGASGRAADGDGDDAGPVPAMVAQARDTLGPLVDARIAAIRAGLGAVETWGQAGGWLDAAAADPDLGAIVAALTPALIAAHLAGRYDVEAGPVEIAAASSLDPLATVALAVSAAAQHTQLPFDEQIAFFRGKTDLNTEAWTDIWHDAHDRVFVVAGAAHDALVADLREAVDEAISDGTTLERFRAHFDAAVAQHGWSYKGGRDWRTRVIYETNLRTSYAAGRYQQMRDVVARRPYWRYRHSHASEEPREDHVRWDGLVLPHDDPWWDTHYPPNGWGCKCLVEALNDRDLERLGKSGPDQAPPVRMRTVTVGAKGPSPRTVEVPEGIDPGWAYAPGRSRVDGRGPGAGGAPRTVAEYVLEGRRIRDELMAEAGGEGASGEAMREALHRRLVAERGAGTVEAKVSALGNAKQDVVAARMVRDGAAELPASWVRSANQVRVSVRHRPVGAEGPLGYYLRPTAAPPILHTPGLKPVKVPPGRAVISTQPTYSTALHEYMHHIQETVPGLDARCVRMHRRRTTRPDGSRDPVAPLKGYPGVVGRKDRYIDPYFGAEYPGPGWPEGPMEVISMTFEGMLRAPPGMDIKKLAEEDPELLDFALGVLMRFDPQS